MDLWTLTQTRPALDPLDLARAIEAQVKEPELDYRTRLLIHEATRALHNFWGTERFGSWLEQAGGAQRIKACAEENFQEVGFPSLAKRLQSVTRPQDIRQFLRQVGRQVMVPTRIVLGGSSSLILAGLLHRATEDLDLVDEVPEPIRQLGSRLGKLQERYSLVLAHFQNHYLPGGWEARLSSQGCFGQLEVFTVDPLDIAVGKLMSRREKDLDDLRLLSRHFSRADFANRLSACASHLLDDTLRANARANWHVLFGDDLPL